MQTVVHFLFAEVSWRLRLGSLFISEATVAKSRRHRRIERDRYSITTLFSLPTLPAELAGPPGVGCVHMGGAAAGQ